jgi:hypothetical protein
VTTRMKTTQLPALLTVGLVAALASCTGGGNSSSPVMDLEIVSNGFGELLPYKVLQLGPNGVPTQQIISIRSEATLLENVRSNNPVRPTPSFGAGPVLPGGASGNHFLYARFTDGIDLASVLSGAPSSQQSGGLTGSITVVAVDPFTQSAVPVKGRAFVNGLTFSGNPVGEPPVLQAQQWVILQDGFLLANPAIDNNGNGTPDGLGFPGTQTPFVGAAELMGPNAFVFVVDSDGDLTTHETFPAGKQIRMQITTAVTSVGGKKLIRQAVATTTVGIDSLSPEAAFEPAPNNFPRITPSAGSQDVDPLTAIVVEFTEAIQPLSLGDLPSNKPPTLSPAISVKFGPPASVVDMPFNVMPISVFDLTTYRLTPAFNFPGAGPNIASCGTFNRVDVEINSGQFQDLVGNINSQGGSSFFLTGEGPGIVNVPVAPDVIYVARSVPEQGVSVIDLNGFGASTGNPTFDPTFQVLQEGDSNYVNNPNLRLQGAFLRPALTTPTCTFDGGSAGVFTLTKDSSLNDLVLRAPLVLQPGDMMLGQALDAVFTNAPAPFGCQAGGGNLCALDGQKFIQIIVGGPNTVTPPILNNPIENTAIGGNNMISWAPHPNPPPLQFPPLCVSPFLGGKEPTSVDTTGVVGLQNLLVPGDPFGNPNAVIPIPPSGLLSPEQNAWFQGPSLPVPNIAACSAYMVRQQVGQFLYMVDRARRELVVLNSNRMTVLDRIQLPDPTELAMSPNLNLLAVSNQNIDLVTFIDINPSSATFHQIIQQTVVGRRPRGIVWETGNEDILVCNEGDNSVSILSAFSLQVRKVVSSQLDRPFAMAVTPRQNGFGLQRGVYFAWILNRNGRIALFESGPSGVNGWGFDDVIGIAPQTFQNPKAIQPDHIDLRSSVWVAHEGPLSPVDQTPGGLNVPALTNVTIESGIIGQLPLNVQSLSIPQFRDMSVAATVSLGPNVLSGIPVDIAFDNMRNMGGLVNFHPSGFSAGIPARLNGKSLVRQTGAQGLVNTNEPQYMFVAIPSPQTGSNGVVDVIDIGGGFTRVNTSGYNPPGSPAQSVRAPGAFLLADYFRQ